MNLDYNSLATWENLSDWDAAHRICSSDDSGNCNPGAITVFANVLKRINDNTTKAQFCLNCENLGLRDWKFYSAYSRFCCKDYSTFIQCVLTSDKLMINAIRKEEMEYRYSSY